MKTKLPHSHHNENEEKILDCLPSDEMALKVAEALNILSDPSRLKIFWFLCHCEECVTDISSAVKMSSPAVSHHLRLLKASGFIVANRQGKEMLYKVADNKLSRELHHTIENIASITCPKL